ncbi:AsmA family protein [Phytohalomonas tamaricis]|uniref:AsmA family protein n=1 Tax=Phytohalomonas tamaricis TaxID=2081032 RepID=UPI000D0B20EA|nr:AsmA family protein [Phytohalomonas tamaricis]
MKALFRALLAAVGVLALLVVCGVIYVTTFLDPNELKPRLVEAVHERTGLDLTLNGPLSWTFYPRLGVTIEDAEARLPDQPEQDSPFAAFKRADVKVKFAPLLAGDVSIDGITLDGLRLELVRDEQGQGNWEMLIAQMAQDDDTVSDTRPREAPRSINDAANRPLGVDIANVQVTDSQVHYVDVQHNRDLRLTQLALTGTNVSPGRSFPLTLSFDLASSQPALTSHVELASKVQINLRESRYQLQQLALKTTSWLPELATEQTQTVNLNADNVVADLAQKQYLINGASIIGNARLPQLTSHELPFALAFNADAALQEQTGHVRNIVLTSGKNLNLTGELTFSQLMDKPKYNGNLQLSPMDLRAWLDRLDIEPLHTADPDALTNVSLASPLSGDLDHVDLTNVTLGIDDQTFLGQLGAQLDGKSVDFNLQGDRLDLDAYLPPAEEKTEDTTAMLTGLGIAPVLAASEGAEQLPVDWLRTFALNGTINVGELKIKDMLLTDVALRATGGNGLHRLEQLSANLYGGTLKANGELDVRKTPAQLSMDETVSDVQLEPLLKNAANREQLIRGKLALNGKFTSSTNTLDALVRNLNGSATFSITDGAILGTNISQQLCTAVAALQGKESSREWGADTPFDHFGATAKVSDGVVHNDDLLITVPGIELAGKGEANLATTRFDYALGARFIDTADQQACSVSDKLQKVRIPIRCEGEFTGEPQQWCYFDREGVQQVLMNLATDEGKKKLQQRLNETLDGDLGKKIDEKLGEDSGKELRNAIQGLFK